MFQFVKSKGDPATAVTNESDNGALIQVKNVIKRFPVGDTEITILKGVNFEVQPGEFVTITGPSGNGKSTLLNMITGIDRPSEGEVIVTGKPVHTMSENQLAGWRGEKIGIIFQFFQMLPALSLVQNVILPMDFVKVLTPAERRERAMHLLEMVGLADQAFKLPSMVSGGQQQRAAIARALANDPPIIVADEPTGNLDTKTEESIFSLFEQLTAEGKTMLMVTHSRRLAARIPRQIEISDGVIARDEVRSISGLRPSD
jgi:ABC-type lipoprotein export system ATPase subunit